MGILEIIGIVIAVYLLIGIVFSTYSSFKTRDWDMPNYFLEVVAWPLSLLLRWCWRQ